MSSSRMVSLYVFRSTGKYRFPGNTAITSVEAAAKAKTPTGAFSQDPILFGKWRD
jgi:hypothetical protein